MPKQSIGESLVRFFQDLDELNPDDNDSVDSLASYFYIPDSRISTYLNQLKSYIELEKPTPTESREAGNLLEQIATLTFLGLKGLTSIKSFRSPSSQYDLLVGGDGEKWFAITKILRMQIEQRDIVIEAKCIQDKVSDQQFARLCSLMDINLFHTTGLGIFFTLNGASGFPERGSNTRLQKLSDARMRQVLFHARTGKAIVVLDATDILSLDKPASLIQLLTSKIRELDYLTGIHPLEPCEVQEADLPEHLASLVNRLPSKSEK